MGTIVLPRTQTTVYNPPKGSDDHERKLRPEEYGFMFRIHLWKLEAHEDELEQWLKDLRTFYPPSSVVAFEEAASWRYPAEKDYFDVVVVWDWAMDAAEPRDDDDDTCRREIDAHIAAVGVPEWLAR